MIVKNLFIYEDKTSFFVNEKEIYLKYEKQYEQYVSSNYDGPLLLVLPIAMRNNENLIIKGNVSYKLYHNITHYLMKIITIILPRCKPIKIEVDGFTYGDDHNNVGVGCGLSCGIDSLCCLQDYYFDMEDGPFKITHVTNFDAGASHNNIVFNKRLANVENYCNDTELSMMKIVTNFTSINDFKHQKIHVLRNLCIPLFFQKLFCKYYFSSGQSYPDNRIFVNNFNINDLEVQHILFDPIIMNLISTEKLEFIIHGSQYNRAEKTEKVSNNALSYKYLDVCVNGGFVEKSNSLNCSECWKCMQTLVTIDYYKKLNNYKNIFNLNKYNKNKNNFLKKLKNNSPYEQELLDLYSK